MIEPDGKDIAAAVDEVTFQLNWLREHEDANPLAIIANQRNRAEEHGAQVDLYRRLIEATERYYDEAPPLVREKWRPFP